MKHEKEGIITSMVTFYADCTHGKNNNLAQFSTTLSVCCSVYVCVWCGVRGVGCGMWGVGGACGVCGCVYECVYVCVCISCGERPALDVVESVPSIFSIRCDNHQCH